MIAKFNYSYTDNGREIIEHVCGKEIRLNQIYK